MTSVVAERVWETSTSTGTGTIALAGAKTGFRAFSSVCAVGDTVEVTMEAVDANGVPTGEWEAGYWTYSAANTLTRTQLKSSSTGSAINFAAGTKNVMLVALLPQESTFLAPSGDTTGATDLANIKAIQAKYSRRRIVYGTGDFYINGTIPMRAFDTHVGQGLNLTYIHPVGTITMFSYNSASTVQSWNIYDLTLYGYSNNSIAIDSMAGTGAIQDVNIWRIYLDGFGNGMPTNANPVIKIGDPWGLRMINSIVEQTGDRPAIVISANGSSSDGAMLTNCKIKNNGGNNVVLNNCHAIQVAMCELYTTGTGKDNIQINGGSGNMVIGCSILGAGTNNYGVRVTGSSPGNVILGGVINGQSASGFTGVSFESGSTLGQVKGTLIYTCPTIISDAAGDTGVDMVTDGTMGGYLRPPLATASTRSSGYAGTGIGYVSVDSTTGVPYFRGQDDWTPMRGPIRSALAADVINNNASANTMANVTGLSFPVQAGATYKFKFQIVYTAAATTTGSRWSINGPAITNLNYRSENSLTTTSRTFNEGLTAYGSPAAANASSAALGSNIAIVEGILTPSAAGTVIARFASEVSSSAIVAKAGLSFVEYERVS